MDARRVGVADDGTRATGARLREIRLAGRGGHGVVTAGELLGQAALLEGRHAQAIPTFGPERRGALAQCTLRISREPILLRCSSLQPDVLAIFDPTIWQVAPVTAGLAEGGTLLVNSTSSAAALEAELRSGRFASGLALSSVRVIAFDATGIALEALGRPITNTAMMGALAAVVEEISLEAVEAILREHFQGLGPANVAAARAGHAALSNGA